MLSPQRLYVNGTEVKIKAYSEARAEEIIKIQTDINKYIDEHPDATFGDDAVRKLRAKWWKRKADVLWDAGKELPLSFFEDKEFESQKLKETEDFFFAHANYL